MLRQLIVVRAENSAALGLLSSGSDAESCLILTSEPALNLRARLLPLHTQCIWNEFDMVNRILL